MKKIYIILVAVIATFILSGQDAFARKYKHEKEVDAQYFPRSEIYVQYGSPTILELVTMLKAPTSFEGYETTNQVFTGTPGVGYNFFLRDDLSIGIFGGYSFAKSDICKETSGNIGTRLYSQGVKNYVGQLSANWTYFSVGPLTMESGLYLGVSYMDREITKAEGLSPELHNQLPKSNEQIKVAYHITACKLRYGNTFGIFGELGFGYRGLVNLGISIKL